MAMPIPATVSINGMMVEIASERLSVLNDFALRPDKLRLGSKEMKEESKSVHSGRASEPRIECRNDRLISLILCYEHHLIPKPHHGVSGAQLADSAAGREEARESSLKLRNAGRLQASLEGGSVGRV